MTGFTEHPTMQMVTSTDFGTRMINEGVAYARYCFDGMCIYQSAEDAELYLFYPMADSERFTFMHGDAALLGELEVLPTEYDALLHYMNEYDAKVSPLGFALVHIIDHGEPSERLVMYYSARGMYCLYHKADLDRLSPAVVAELEKLAPAVNKLSNPYKVTLDGFGDINRLEAVEL